MVLFWSESELYDNTKACLSYGPGEIKCLYLDKNEVVMPNGIITKTG